MYEDENNLYHYSYRKGDGSGTIDTKNYAEDPWDKNQGGGTAFLLYDGRVKKRIHSR